MAIRGPPDSNDCSDKKPARICNVVSLAIGLPQQFEKYDQNRDPFQERLTGLLQISSQRRLDRRWKMYNNPEKVTTISGSYFMHFKKRLVQSIDARLLSNMLT